MTGPPTSQQLEIALELLDHLEVEKQLKVDSLDTILNSDASESAKNSEINQCLGELKSVMATMKILDRLGHEENVDGAGNKMSDEDVFVTLKSEIKKGVDIILKRRLA